MYRSLGIWFLIFCFGLTGVNLALADTQTVNASPVVAQPYDYKSIDQQTLEQDRINREQELEIKMLIDDNQKLAAEALAQGKDSDLEKISETIGDYRDSLVNRDRNRIETNAERVSKYHDLIRLTEDVDDSKDSTEAQLLKSDVIEEKYKILLQLKDEMLALNEKLKNEEFDKNFHKINQLLDQKIQLLTQRLGEMDQRIAHYDDVIVQKNEQIAQLKDNLANVEKEIQSKEATIQDQKNQISILQNQPKGTSSDNPDKSQTKQLTAQLAQKQEQIELLKEELEKKLIANVSSPQIQYSSSAVQAPVPAVVPQSNSSSSAQDSLLARIKDLEQQKEELKKELAEAQSQKTGDLFGPDNTSSVVEEHGGSKESDNAMQDQIKDLKAQRDELKNELAQLQDQKAVDVPEATKATPSVLIQSDGTTDVGNDLRHQVQDLKLERAELRDQLQDQIKDLLAQRDDLKKQLAQEKDQITALQNNSSAYIKEHKTAIESIQTDLVSLQTKVERQEADLKKKDDTILSLNQLLANSKNKGENPQALTDILQDQIKDLKSQRDEMRQELADLQGHETMVKVPESAEVPAVIVEHDVPMDVNNELRHQVKDLQSQREELRSQLQNQVGDLLIQRDTLSKELAQQKSQIIDIQQHSSAYIKEHKTAIESIQSDLISLQTKVEGQELDLKKKDESIRWLNQLLATSKNKTKYYQLTAQEAQMSLQQVQQEVQLIKGDFAQRVKNYDHFENAISSLEKQVNNLSEKLAVKQEQVELLKSELEYKLIQENDERQLQEYAKDDLKIQVHEREKRIALLQSQISQIVQQESDEQKNHQYQQSQMNEDLKAQAQEKEIEISHMKTDIQSILQAEANKENYARALSAKFDDRLQMAQELIDLQQKETILLEEKNKLRAAQNEIFDKHVLGLESKIKQLSDTRHVQDMDLQGHMDELKDELAFKEQLVASLKVELGNRVAQEKSQVVLANQIEDLKSQINEKDRQITSMRAIIQSGQETKLQADTLKRELADQQDKIHSLNAQLQNKITESNKMGIIIADYQKKLESKDNAYNQELAQGLASKNYIENLNLRLQQKEAEIVRIKKDMYDWQETMSHKDKDLQSQELTLSITQQKIMAEKANEYQVKLDGLQEINEAQVKQIKSLKTDLALARQQLESVPSSDEVDFLRSGLQKATVELKQKNDMIFRIKANVDEYVKEFKEQSQEFQSLKDQLITEQQKLMSKDEDLKYKDMEILRLKEYSVSANKAEDLENQLKAANAHIKDLQAQVDQLNVIPPGDRLRQKLKQALDKIDQQGQLINELAQKLEAAGQPVNLSR